MIVLDTNVVSSLMKGQPDPAVRDWLDGLAAGSTWITAVTVFEVRSGLARLDPGARRSKLETQFDEIVEKDLEGRILDFDSAAASHAATLTTARMKVGRVQDYADTLIAGIVASRDATLATRNIRHFPDIATVDPWRVGGASS